MAELADQRSSLKMIASENYSSLAVQLAQGNLFTDKYAEGIPDHRFYAGCDNVDAVESLAAELACDLFGADHAYMQPHSGADANLVAYWAILEKRVQAPFMEEMGQTDPSKLNDSQWAELRSALGNQRLLGLSMHSGGHLTHGYRHNLSAKMFESASYDVDRETGLLDYDALRAQAKAFRPLVLLAGYSAYPRHIDFATFREIADEVGAVLMVDMAHFSGLVAGKVFTGINDPVAHADVVTSTTHKTLRGPRGGMVLCTDEFSEHVDRGCPMVLGGPLPHAVAAKAVALREASGDDFRHYAQRYRRQRRRARAGVRRRGDDRGDGRHRQPPDAPGRHALRAHGPAGRVGPARGQHHPEQELAAVRRERPLVHERAQDGHARADDAGHGRGRDGGDSLDRQACCWTGTEATTITRGKNAGSRSKARFRTDADALQTARGRVADLLQKFPLYPELDLEFLQAHFS